MKAAMDDTVRIVRILDILSMQGYGLTMLESLKTDDPFKVLIATVLSVRARDEQTIKVVDYLFKRFNTPEKISSASDIEIEDILRPIGFYRIKRERIKRLSRNLLENFNGKVPQTEKELLSLEGVGRKVANCVLTYSFGRPAIAVDIHVHRINNRIGVINTKTPEETEISLMRIVPKDKWKMVNELFVLHGQRICKPVLPLCGSCSIERYCEKRI